KAVYCEWPLGRDLEEARAMAALAAEKGVRTVVGLQARQAPAIEFVQQLLGDGYVGEVLSTSMVGLSVLGGTLVQPNAYMLDKTNGANLLTVAFGHSLDVLHYVLGEPAEPAVPTALTQTWPTLTSLEAAPAFNVARAYAAFAADIDNGTHTVPDLADAVRRHEVIAAIERSATSGRRVKA